MTIKVEIVKDSINPWGSRLTTFLLAYPRFFHAEFLTHRMLSRNCSSSRAIPFARQMAAIQEDPAMPLSWLENKKGMQGGEPLSEADQIRATEIWLEARDFCIDQALKLAKMGVAKQYVNRLLEPWAHITVVCSATNYDNFFALRCHPDAQPEIQALAHAMLKAYKESIPVRREAGEWHLPFVVEGEIPKGAVKTEDVKHLIEKSVASCARVSYKNHDKTDATEEQNHELYERLLNRFPIHASPAEHQAQVEPPWSYVKHPWSSSSGNFQGGWIQYRKTLKNECVEKFEGLK